MKEYRAAIIGSGNRGEMHAEAYERIENGVVTACCDIVAEKAERLAETLGIKSYTDVDKMLEAEQPDIVHIATPPTARYVLLEKASSHGVNACTIEKPLAVGVKDWKQLCALAENTSTKIAVCHQFRWHENFNKCREALTSGRLGKLLFLDISSGMNISGQGTHLLNYGFALNGDVPVERVFGNASGKEGMQGYHPGPDTTEGYLLFANGVRAFWNNGYTAPVTGDPETEYQHVRLAGYAERGRVLWEEFAKWEIVTENEVEKGDYGSMEVWKNQNLEAQAAFHRAMLEWIENDDAPTGTNFRQSLHEWKTVLALYYSSLARIPVDVASFDPPEDLFDRLKEALR